MSDKKTTIRIGTRASKLALIQAEEVKKILLNYLGWENKQVIIVEISTLGDRITDRPFRELQGKGVFCREIEREILAGSIDMGVHSLKDMPFEQPDGLGMTGYLKRENPLDVLITNHGETIASLSSGLTLGTSSIRRQKQILQANSGLNVVEIRGNIDTRINKWKTGEIDVIILAAAGLNRMGIWQVPRFDIPMETCLPAPAQGVICVETRTDDLWLNTILNAITHPTTKIMVETERNFLHTLEGSCELPVGALAKIKGPEISLVGEFYSERKGKIIRGKRTGLISAHIPLGKELAETLLAMELD